MFLTNLLYKLGPPGPTRPGPPGPPGPTRPGPPGPPGPTRPGPPGPPGPYRPGPTPPPNKSDLKVPGYLPPNPKPGNNKFTPIELSSYTLGVEPPTPAKYIENTHTTNYNKPTFASNYEQNNLNAHKKVTTTTTTTTITNTNTNINSNHKNSYNTININNKNPLTYVPPFIPNSKTTHTTTTTTTTNVNPVNPVKSNILTNTKQQKDTSIEKNSEYKSVTSTKTTGTNYNFDIVKTHNTNTNINTNTNTYRPDKPQSLVVEKVKISNAYLPAINDKNINTHKTETYTQTYSQPQVQQKTNTQTYKTDSKTFSYTAPKVVEKVSINTYNTHTNTNINYNTPQQQLADKVTHTIPTVVQIDKQITTNINTHSRPQIEKVITTYKPNTYGKITTNTNTYDSITSQKYQDISHTKTQQQQQLQQDHKTIQHQTNKFNTNTYNSINNPTISSHIPAQQKSTKTETSTENCSCGAAKKHHTSSTFSTFNNQYKTQYTTTVDQANILNATSQLKELPVYAPAPGYQATYAPDKIPKGAVVVFMPVIILPEEAYANCDENQKLTYQQNALGVQPTPIRSSFNSIFGLGGDQNKQCMCPCSCTQNLPESFHKKRETEGANLNSEFKSENIDRVQVE